MKRPDGERKNINSSIIFWVQSATDITMLLLYGTEVYMYRIAQEKLLPILPPALIGEIFIHKPVLMIT